MLSKPLVVLEYNFALLISLIAFVLPLVLKVNEVTFNGERFPLVTISTPMISCFVFPGETFVVLF